MLPWTSQLVVSTSDCESATLNYRQNCSYRGVGLGASSLSVMILLFGHQTLIRVKLEVLVCVF